MNKGTFILPEGVTDAQINSWKTKHGDVSGVTVKANGKEYKAIFKPVTFSLLSAFMAKEKANNEIEGIELMYNTCKLYADEAVEKNDMLKMKAVEAFMTTFKSATTSLENL